MTGRTARGDFAVDDLPSDQPHSGITLLRKETATAGDLQSALERSDEAFRSWRRTTFWERARVLRTAAELLRSGADAHARLMAEEMGGSVAKGALCLLSGEIAQGPGWYYRPTVLAGVGPGMPAYREEVFGPVASIVTAKDRTRAIEVANDTSFGLGAAVFTAYVDEGERIAREELRAGCCFVNTFVRSDPGLPFGGIMDSGYGRELGRHGIRELVNAKTLYVA